ncbi:hypothetical protein EJ08DRAFT_528239 [Tothia fuscella]|uniref:WW domain-containing protein n=1 Tax=Tothia fuscella TaxID=1048955 RepID=A0A9P4TSR5_9PEZI|nr:hypothetical protein EJ08DRAFT_528239 [Tothia fuscella]
MSMEPPPPSYEASTSSGPSPRKNEHRERNGIPPDRRRSMEDEQRPLPHGWVRSFDPKSSHQFFVNTTTTPPRSIWHHPLDDEEYLASLSPQERENITRLHRSVSLKDIEAESSDDEDHAGPSKRPAPKTAVRDEPHGLYKVGRKMKDRITQSTHVEREKQRQQRAIEEQQAYQAHEAARRAMVRAMETGQPQFLCKDRQGNDVYIEPPQGPALPPGGRGYNPYQNGPYANPNARFVRPDYPYNRPYGYGYGGGYGMPLAGGFLGGALLGGLLF